MIFGKKAAIAGAVSLAILWPFASGQLAQKLFEKQFSQFHHPNLKITTLSYDRGYLTSTIQTEIAFTQFPHSKPLLINTELSHGVIGVEGKSELEMTDALKSAIDSLWQKKESPIHVEFYANLFGKLSFAAEMEALTGKLEQLTIKTNPIVFNAVIEMNGDLNSTLNAAKVSLRHQSGEQIHLEGVVMNASGQMVDDIWLGQQGLSVQHADLGLNHYQVKLEDARIESDNTLLKSELVSEADEKTLQELVVSKNKLQIKAFGLNELNVSDVDFGLDLSGLDFKILNQIAQLNGQSGQVQQLALITAVNQLIAKGMQLELNPANITIGEQSIVSDMTLNLEPGVQEGVQSLQSLLDHINGHVNLKLPKALIGDSSSFLMTQLDQKGFLSVKEDDYLISFNIVGDKMITDDGQMIPFGWLLIFLNTLTN